MGIINISFQVVICCGDNLWYELVGSRGSKEVNVWGQGMQLKTLVKIRVQRHRFTKRLRFNWKLTEHSPLPDRATTSTRLQYNYSGWQLKSSKTHNLSEGKYLEKARVNGGNQCKGLGGIWSLCHLHVCYSKH